MYIKSITLQGFKSYREQLTAEFSDKTNIVVGRNGAGKSNFFSAIRFVLSDAYTSLSRQERQNLLHEGSSTAATFSAYVEIIFDNSDGRFQTGKDEVVLRRTIGAKKDDYSLDRKSTSKAEVMSMLESAGFSRSNPFYIVPQGRVTALTNQKDNERLELLKEIAGTRVYEDRRTESVKIMEDTDQKRVKIDELLEYIDERLNELEEEKKELKEFQGADRERRCLEYAIYQHDLEEATGALATIEEERLNEHAAESARRDETAERERAIAALETEISILKERIELVSVEREQQESDKRESHKAKTQVELLIKDLEEASTRNVRQRETLQADLEALETEIEEKEEELTALEPRYEATLTSETNVRTQLEQAEAKQKTLYDKQGRASQFRTQKERDTFLRKEIDKDKAFLSNRERALDGTSANINNAKETVETKKAKEAEIREELEHRKEDMAKWNDELRKIAKERNEVDERKKEMWRDESSSARLAESAKLQLAEAEKVLYQTMDRATQTGLQAVERITDKLGLHGNVHGPLYSLFETDEMFRTAVEVTAGTSLFHIVVDTDETASAILDVMVKERSGRVTFMPLNRLRPKPVNYPQDAEDAVPMLNKLRFDPMYKPAMQQVFSKTIMCPDLTIGGQYSRNFNLTAITLAGDKYERKGSMTGGYHDRKKSRLDATRALQAGRSKYGAEKAKNLEASRNIRVIEQELAKLVGEQQVLERKLKHARDNRGPLLEEAESLAREIDQAKNRISMLEGQQREIKSEITNLKFQIQGHEEELQTPLRDALTQEENTTLKQLATEIQAKKRELTSLTKDRSGLSSKKTNLESELSQNLRRKRDAMKGKLEAIAEGVGEASGATQGGAALDARQNELKRLEEAITTHAERIDAIDTEIEETNTTILHKQKEVESVQAKQTEETRIFNRQQKNAERNLMKRQILLSKKDDLNKQIRELGVLPEEAYERHNQHIKVEKLIKSLHKTKEVLKKFTSVNKKAFDQYNEFTKQRDDLTKRREELEESATSITELIDTLDMRKDEAIERTFKQVSKNFSEVFEKLVPVGRGRLIMQSAVGEEDESEDEQEEEEEEEEQEDDDEEEDNDEEENESDEEDENDDEDMDEDVESTSTRRKGAAVKGKKAAKGKSASSSKAKPKGKTAKQAKKKTPAKKLTKKQQQEKAKKLKKKASKIDNYTGVSIKVSFNSKSDEGLRIQQLSGGQKSLVALAVIFAIQKCDPAPFYLFDEIDANLDADRRTAVAGMVRELSEDAQFIITTFRPELVGTADNFLGVVFDNRKVSSIRSITQDDAYDFVEAAEGRK